MESVTVRLTFGSFTTIHGDHCALSLLASDDGMVTVYLEVGGHQLHLSAEDWERLKSMVIDCEAGLAQIAETGVLKVAIADVAPYRKADLLKGLDLPKGKPLPHPYDEIFPIEPPL